MQSSQRAGLSLVELLVVVTIIVLLLALLAPAMDRAIYQAELAKCAANQAGIVTGLQVYAIAHNRTYPRRDGAVFYTPYVLASKPTNGAGADSRPALRTFLSVQAALNDPLCQAVNLDRVLTSPPNAVVWSSYTLFFGYGYKGERAMLRLGQRWTFGTDTFSILTGDYLMSFPDYLYSTHPDRAAALAAEQFNNQDFVQKYGPNGAAVYASTQGAKYTYSRWIGSNDPGRTFDHNFAYDDGSVLRVAPMTTNLQDPRLTSVSLYNDKSNATYQLILPQP